MTQNETKSLPVAIIGWGTAGVNAAIALRNAGYEGEIHAFSDTDTLPYSPILTSYFVGNAKTYEQCFPWTEPELGDLAVTVHACEPVTSLDSDSHTIETAKGAYSYQKCVVCSGARAMTFGFPKVEGYEPIVLRTLDQAQEFKRRIEDESCRRVLVSGASMIALKSLEACLNHGLDCSLVGVNPHILDFNALPAAAERFEKGLREQGVNLRFNDALASVRVLDVEEAASNGNRLEVVFKSGDVEFFDEIVVAHGVRSDLSFIKEGSIEVDRAILVDDFMRTSAADVFAAGDVAQALELISGEKRIIGLWKTAAVQGACAGTAIAAELAGAEPAAENAYKGAIVTNTIHVNGTLFISAGVTVDAEDTEVEVRESEDMTVVYVYRASEDGKRQLVGFNVACDKDEPGSVAFDTGAMLTLRIESAFRKR